MFKAFWIVWSPQGRTPPKYRHPAEDSAKKEAVRLALCNPGCEFFVCMIIGSATVTKATWQAATTLGTDEEIPF